MAYFFKKFEKIDYAFISDPNNKKQVTNILTSFFLRKIKSYKSVIFQKYTIKDEDTLESLSDKLYSSPLHYWVFLVINDIIDPFSEWAKDSYLLEKFVSKKYAEGRKLVKTDGTSTLIPFSSGLGGIHHFMNINTGRICDDVEDEYYRSRYAVNPTSIGKNIIPVTNIQYESDLDIEKRSIYIISKNHLLDFEESFNNMLAGR